MRANVYCHYCHYCRHDSHCHFTRYRWIRSEHRHGLDSSGCTPSWTLVGRIIHWLDTRWH